MVNHDKLRIYTLYVVDDSVGSFPYQVSMAVYRTVMPLTGNEESGFDFGEGAWETATTSKEGSRRANFPIVIDWGSDDQ